MTLPDLEQFLERKRTRNTNSAKTESAYRYALIKWDSFYNTEELKAKYSPKRTAL